MSYGVVVVARNLTDVKLRLPNMVIVDGERSLNECRNIGAKRWGDKDFIAFVDDDNEVTEDALDKLEESFVLGIDAASPVILDKVGRIWFAGSNIDAFGRSRKVYRGEKGAFTGTFHDCFMVRRSAFEKAGGFDSDAFPFFLGEADLSERMNHTYVVNPESKVIHDIDLQGGIIRNSHIGSAKRAYYVARNQIIFVRRYRHLSLYLLFWFPVRTVAHLGAMVKERKWDYVREYLRGIHDGLGRSYR